MNNIKLFCKKCQKQTEHDSINRVCQVCGSIADQEFDLKKTEEVNFDLLK
jgi:Zn finger protein HypA/HybF involved in hydrogenase expression